MTNTIVFVDEFSGGDHQPMVKPAKKKPGPKKGTRQKRRAVWSEAQRRAFPDRVRELMAASGLRTNRIVARASGISEGTISSILKGHRKMVDPSTLERLADVFNCSVDFLSRGSDYVSSGAVPHLSIIMIAEQGIYKMSHVQVASDLGTIEDSVPSDERYSNLSRFGVLIRDDNLEALDPPALRGMVARVVAFNENFMEIENGYIYLISQENKDGHVETAFRRAIVYRDSYKFTPVTHSLERDESEKVTIWRDGRQTEQKVTVIGLYYSASTPRHAGPPPIRRRPLRST